MITVIKTGINRIRTIVKKGGKKMRSKIKNESAVVRSAKWGYEQ